MDGHDHDRRRFKLNPNETVKDWKDSKRIGSKVKTAKSKVENSENVEIFENSEILDFFNILVLGLVHHNFTFFPSWILS